MVKKTTVEKAVFRTISILIFPALFLLVFSLPPSFAADETDAVLTSAESLFKAMKSRDYVRTWEHLSAKSKETIVEDTYKELVKANVSGSTKERLAGDFLSGDIHSRAYWNAFLVNFDPDAVLEQSRWEMGEIKKDRADVIITHKKSENPAVLQMFRESGAWKVGLVETFWTRK